MKSIFFGASTVFLIIFAYLCLKYLLWIKNYYNFNRKKIEYEIKFVSSLSYNFIKLLITYLSSLPVCRKVCFFYHCLDFLILNRKIKWFKNLCQVVKIDHSIPVFIKYFKSLLNGLGLIVVAYFSSHHLQELFKLDLSVLIYINFSKHIVNLVLCWRIAQSY